jgi:hypothetical protein
MTFFKWFKQVIAYLQIKIDAKFTTVRSQSCPISNFIADLCTIYMNTDLGLYNSGTLRIDSEINEGEFT